MNLWSKDEAIASLLNGGVGVLPTDTLYGIVARAADKQAVQRMYALKSREHKPGTVIAANVSQLVDLGIDKAHLRRVEKWWPGSLSVETPLGAELNYLHQGTGRQGFRVVDNAWVRGILEKTGPLVTSSANLAGKPPAQTIEDAYHSFGSSIDFYVDGGNLAGRKPSTIARLTDKGIEIIRQGAVIIPAYALVNLTNSQSTCPFCLSNKLLGTPILYESQALFVTMPLHSPIEGAFIIVPRLHTTQLTDLSDYWWKDMKAAITELPVKPASFNVTINYGQPAGQTLEHLHFWIVPREDGKPSSGKGLATLVKIIDNSYSGPISSIQ